MNELLWCGVGIVILALAVVVIVSVVYIRRNPDKWRGIIAWAAGYQKTPSSLEQPLEAPPLPTDKMAGKSFAQRLPYLRSDQTVTLIGEGERRVLSGITLVELWQKSGSTRWTPKGGESVGIMLAGDIWLMRVPSTEGGEPAWYKFNYVRSMGLAGFFKGGDTTSTYGPARMFSKVYRQSKPVEFAFPRGVLPGNWQVTDIGGFGAKLNGGDAVETTLIADGDLQMFVSGDEVGGSRRFLFLDPRQEPNYTTRGRGGLFVGEMFNPEEEVSDIL